MCVCICAFIFQIICEIILPMWIHLSNIYVYTIPPCTYHDDDRGSGKLTIFIWHFYQAIIKLQMLNFTLIVFESSENPTSMITIPKYHFHVSGIFIITKNHEICLLLTWTNVNILIMYLVCQNIYLVHTKCKICMSWYQLLSHKNGKCTLSDYSQDNKLSETSN